jgi:hypothetical protein
MVRGDMGGVERAFAYRRPTLSTRGIERSFDADGRAGRVRARVPVWDAPPVNAIPVITVLGCWVRTRCSPACASASV